MSFNLKEYGIVGHEGFEPVLIRNPSTASLVEDALKLEKGSALSSTGALIARSGDKTGRSPADKRIVNTPDESKDVFWESDACIELDERAFSINKERALDFLNTREQLYVMDVHAAWKSKHQLPVRVICARAYHALFIKNMFHMAEPEELADFKPEFVIFNAGQFPANKQTSGMSSKASVDLNLATKELVILGSQYAGEMKKSIFSLMHWLMPAKGHVSLHSSANCDEKGENVALFFGLSGTGKTTLSADPKRRLIGDDEHIWADDGVCSIECGNYAKTIDITEANEPLIYHAIRFGAILENVVYDPHTRVVDYHDTSVTLNTRCSYPISFIPNAVIPSKSGHAKNVILLTCDAFGVLPPVSKLTREQASYHFISGYTSKVAGTEMGITEPKATFSACFGEAFLVRHPAVYGDLLAKKIEENKSGVWLVNTGWSGGGYGEGARMSLKFTRAIIDAIHDGSLVQAPTETLPIFNLEVPTVCPGVPSEILMPKATWKDKAKYDETLKKLATLFQKNFEKYSAGASEGVNKAGPKL